MPNCPKPPPARLLTPSNTAEGSDPTQRDLNVTYRTFTYRD